MTHKVVDGPVWKEVIAPDYNLLFNKETGYTEVWGETIADDPDYCPYGPNLADIELSAVVSTQQVSDYENNDDFTVVGHGCTGVGCRQFCYKNNGQGPHTVSMSLQRIRKVLDKLPPTICQIAYGICSVSGCPDLINILNETRRRGIIPNLTVNGMDRDEEIAELAKVCGAIAVSVNEQNQIPAFATIERLHNYGMEQVNIHYVLSEESYDFALQLLEDINNNPLWKKAVQAVIFLRYKPKNPSCTLSTLSDPKKFGRLLKSAEEKEIAVGMDSCSAPQYLEYISSHPAKQQLARYVMSCESTRESIYINMDGIVFPCSFMEGEDDWTFGINVIMADDFIDDVWNNEKIQQFRAKCVNCIDKGCPCDFFEGE